MIMTPEQRAREIVESDWMTEYDYGCVHLDTLADRIAQAIRDQRESCAKFVEYMFDDISEDSFLQGMIYVGRVIAAELRKDENHDF